MKTLKTHAYFIVFFGGLFLAFFWTLLSLKAAFVLGDNGVQFFPWTLYYAEKLKAGNLPYWTTLMACGFPLAAEGQTAVYYALHLFLYAIFPFKLVYAWSVPLHSLLGGIGFYIYAQKIGLKKEGAALAAALFSFSSAYGGCFYTTGTLRVLTWLPWAMILLEKISHEAKPKKHFFYISLLGILFSQMWTGGFPQATVYSFLYIAVLILLNGKNKRKLFLSFFAAGVIGFILALPQIVSTLELAKVSVRQAESLSFALWGSVLPPALISLFFPHWGIFLRVSFYIGILPFFMVILAIFFHKPKPIWSHIWLALLFFALALGKYNPLYVFVLKLFSFNFLRNPAKFLFFSAVSLSVIAGYGFDSLLGLSSQHKKIPILKKVLLVLFGTVCFLPVIAGSVFYVLQKPLLGYGHRYAESVFYSKTDPMHALQDYYARVENMLLQLKDLFSFENPWSLICIFFASASFVILWSALNKAGKSKTLRIAVWTVVSLDLYLFGHFFGYGFVGNASSSAPTRETAAVVERIQDWQSHNGGNVVEWAKQGNELLEPNSNMRYSIAHAGGYSPLLIQRYYELVKDLGIVDSSLGRHPFSKETWAEQRRLLDLLGVNLVIADEKLDFEGFGSLDTISGRYFYKNSKALPSLYAVFNWKEISNKEERLKYLKSRSFDPSSEAVLEELLPVSSGNSPLSYKPAVIIHQEPERLEAEIDLPADAVLVFRNAYYPRWKTEVDGSQQKLLAVDHALCGVFVKKGAHRIKFYMDKTPYHKAELFSLVFLLLLLILNWVFWGSASSRKNKKSSPMDYAGVLWILMVLFFYILWVVLPKLRG